MTEVTVYAENIIRILNLSASPVGVRFLSPSDPIPNDAERLIKHRYCQALMKARDGENVLLDAKGISCPAAAAAFGFKPLPENLKNGKGLVGFGIVEKQDTGQQMFNGMNYFPPGEVKALHLFPLDKEERYPDIVIIEDAVEKLMWISLAYLNITGGNRVNSTTAVLQATCVDATIIPYQENRLNQCFGCYGCRDATNILPSEAVVGFPGKLLPSISETLTFLNQKAIPVSRDKKAFRALA